MKICFIPIDNRPVCYTLPKNIVEIDDNLELFIPPREFLGSLTKYANVDKLFEWIESIPQTDCMIISLDTLAYGGLIPSRRINDSFEQIKSRIERLKPLLKDKKVYAFSSIMRISNNNYNEEEKEYWKDYGKKIFEYSYSTSKTGKPVITSVPQNILNDYIETRKRNFRINKLYLEWEKEGLFDTLIFSKDDCAEYGLNVDEAREIEKLGGKTKTGADEIPLTLLARAIDKNIKVYIEYTEPDYKGQISNYEDVSIEQSVLGQLELAGYTYVTDKNDADLILVVNNFVDKQGELVMGWQTEPYKGCFVSPKKPYAVADVRFANGGDNNFVSQLLNSLPSEKFYGYSGWNTSANTLGSLLAGIKARWGSSYNTEAFNKLQVIRFLDDWAYQANVREKINAPCEIKQMMLPFESKVSKAFQVNTSNINYTYPWNRRFEIEVTI